MKFQIEIEGRLRDLVEDLEDIYSKSNRLQIMDDMRVKDIKQEIKILKWVLEK